MIWQLTREQLRSQKRFIAWTAGMLVVALSLMTYSAIMYATQQQNDRDMASITGMDAAHQVYAFSVVSAADDDLGEAGDDTVALEVVDAALARAIAAGSDVQAERPTNMVLFERGNNSTGIIAVTGDFDWDALLVSGAAPASGEVAISSALAQRHGVGIGDSVAAFPDSWMPGDAAATEASSTQVPLTVSGLTKSAASADDFDAFIPEAFASWEDSQSLSLSAYADSDSPIDDVAISTSLFWNTGGDELASLGDASSGALFIVDSGWLRIDIYSFLAFVLALGAVVMALAIGNNQARARVGWVGTVRAMGVRRSTVAAATAVESLIVGIGAAGIGILVGIVAASLRQANIRGSVPDPFYPSSPVITVELLIGLVVVGVLLSAIISAVPAYLASRIEPVEALKPVEPNVHDAASRGRRGNGLVYIWLGTLAVFASAMAWQTFVGQAGPLPTILGAAAIVLGGMVAYRALKGTMRRVGGRLGDSRRPWAIAAGGALEGRPAASTTSAVIFMCVVAPMVLITPLLLTVPGEGASPEPTDGFGQALWVVALVVFLVALGVATIIGVGVHATNTSAARIDSATRAALGMSRAQEKKARFWQYWISALIGAGFGIVIGLAVLGMWAIAATANSSSDLDGIGLGSLLAPLVGMAIVIGVTLVFTAGGAAAFASRTPKGMPVEELARA